MLAHEAIAFDVDVERLGLVLEPSGDPTEAEGTLNPASARARSAAWLSSGCTETMTSGL